jgi:hypothetical protein
LRGNELIRKVEYEKTPDGKETFKVTVSASGHRGQGSSTPVDQRPPPGRPRMIKPSHLEIGN